MKIHVYGNKNKPELMLLPGNCLNGQDVFATVIELLRDTYHIICVCYDGFDGNEKTVFTDMETEAKTIEKYIGENYDGKVFAAYGSGLGGSFVAFLAQRGQIKFTHAIIGGADFDHPSKSVAWLESRLFAPSFYKMIHTGVPMSSVAKEMASLPAKDSYVRQLRLMGVGKGGLSYVKKDSVKNQFYSECVTKIMNDIEIEGTLFYYLLAGKMGDEYIKRCRKHFKKIEIVKHPHNQKAEELLFSYPEEWALLIRGITGYAPMLEEENKDTEGQM